MIKRIVFSNLSRRLPLLFSPKLQYTPAIFSFSTASKLYYPLKKLDFSKEEFQCIYKNKNLQLFAASIGKSITLGFAPSGLFFIYYMALLDIHYIWNIALLGTTIGMGFVHAYLKVSLGGLFIYELHINKNADKFKVFLTKNALKTTKKDMIEIEFEEKDIKNRRFVKYDFLNKTEEVTEKDMLVLEVNAKLKRNVLFEVNLYLNKNFLEVYNEYLIALGQNKKIIMR